MGREHERTISTFVLRSPAEFARSAGVDVDRVLRRHGIEPDALHEFGARAPALASMEAWTEMARRSGDPDFGLHLAAQEVIGVYDVLGYIVRASPDLGRGFEQLVRYQRLLGDASRISVHIERTSAILTYELLVPVRDARHIVEHALALAVQRAREFTRSDWRPLAVGFRHAAPASVALHARVFGAEVRFGQLTDAMSMDPATLAWPLRESDHRLAAVLERHAKQALDRLPPPGEFAALVRGAVSELLKTGDVGAAAVARRLNTSARTLQRRLAGEGTSLRELVDAARRSLADEYLAQRWLTMEDIALLLGFADASGFTHAFRRWTGRPPTEYRRELTRDARVGT